MKRHRITCQDTIVAPTRQWRCALLSVAILLSSSVFTSAQVPPRSEARQEQRAKLIRAVKDGARTWCGPDYKPGPHGNTHKGLFVLSVRLADEDENGAAVFEIACPDAKIILPKGYTVEDMILFWWLAEWSRLSNSVKAVKALPCRTWRERERSIVGVCATELLRLLKGGSVSQREE